MYHIYIYIHVCINCCLTVEPRYLEQFCHQKRLQTFANESRGPVLRLAQDSRFKIQDPRFKIQDPRFKIVFKKKNFLNPETLLILAPGFKKFFLDLESWILDLESWILDLESWIWILNLGSWILNLESWASLSTWAPGLVCKRLQTLLVTKLL